MRKIILLNFCFIGILALSLGCKKNESKDVAGMAIPELQAAANAGNDQAMVRLLWQIPEIHKSEKLL